MGYIDTVTKEYMRENAVFADAFNYLIYDGEQIVDPERLHELDTTEIALPFGSDHEHNNDPHDAVQKYRDVLKSAVIMQDDEASYVLLGIENQRESHYAMPVRNIVYDALQYNKQVSDIAAVHKKDGSGSEKHSKSEYLSGFYKNDRIYPVITLVIHFGADKWDGPMSLYDMMDLKNPKLRSFVQDYHIHLIDPARMTDDDLLKFSTSLREVMGYIKYSKDRIGLNAFINDNPRMTMEINAARVIKAITKTPFEINEDMEVIDVCKAIEEMMAEAKAEACKAMEEMMSERENKGIAEGRASGIVEGKIRALADLVRDGLLSLSEAAKRADMSESDFEAAAAKLS